MSLHQLKYSILGLFLFFGGFLSAQEDKNPFELQHRLEEGDIDRQTPLNANNPFDISPKVATDIPETTAPKTTKKKIVKSRRAPREMHKTSSNFRFWLTTLSWLFLMLLTILYRSVIGKTYRAFLNENFLKMIHREEGRIASIPFQLLNIFFFISLSTFIYLLAEHFRWPIGATPLESFGICFGGVVVIYLIKNLILFLLAGVFPFEKDIRKYRFTIIIFSAILGICLLPLNTFIAFTNPDLARVLIYLTMALIGFILIFRALRMIFVVGNKMFVNKFHFFMYLCAVEIAPVLVLIKIILLQGVTL